jgi:undecaprenyl-diphosphatase
VAVGIAVVFALAASRSSGHLLTAPKAVVLGAVEGITEFLPVSSTGHLVVAQRLLGLGHDGPTRAALDSYLIVIQGGAILAVAWLLRRRLAAMGRALLPHGRETERGLIGSILTAAVPTAIIGLALGDVVQRHLFGVGPVAAAWVVGGLALLILDRRIDRRAGLPLQAVTSRQALAIGLVQSLALWPGMSRSLVTIAGGCAVGLSLSAAVEFSFLLGLVTLLGATGLELVRHGSEIVTTFGLATPLLGAGVAFVTAVASIRWLVGMLSRRGMAPFGWYRLTAGVVAASLLLLAR